jgi:formylglycine-generating enzyme required for sulfatase activity
LTSRYYGEGQELLGRYAWHQKNSLDRGLLPGGPGQFGVLGGRLKPNDFGLFDMLGNAMEWCQDPIAHYPPEKISKASEDIEYNNDINDKLSRVLRGGSFYFQPVYVRSAGRNRLVPAYRDVSVGFRPARTFR